EPAPRVPGRPAHLAGRSGGDRPVSEQPNAPGTFAEVLADVPFDVLLPAAHDAPPAAVSRALLATSQDRTLADFAALLSPAAGSRLEELAAASRALTLARFGRTMRMYAPLYLSNE